MLHDDLPIQVDSIVRTARSLSITDQASLTVASEILTNRIKPMLKKIDDTFRPIQRAQDAAKAETLKKRKELEQPLLEAEGIIKAAQKCYYLEIDRQRRQAEEAAARAREEERRRIEAERSEAADRLAADGLIEDAVALLDEPILALVPPVQIDTPKATGISARRSWSFRIIDEAKIPRAYLLVDEKKIAKIVKALGPDAAATVPGIEVFEDLVIAARTA